MIFILRWRDEGEEEEELDSEDEAGWSRGHPEVIYWRRWRKTTLVGTRRTPVPVGESISPWPGNVPPVNGTACKWYVLIRPPVKQLGCQDDHADVY